jgi:nucleoid-associated protein YgaU
MAKNSVKAKQKTSSKTAPTPKKVTQDPKEFEKSVIKDMENSKLRIKPWVLKLLGGVFILAGIGFIVYPLISDRISINLPDVFDRNEQEVAENKDENSDDEDEDTENDDEDSDEDENTDKDSTDDETTDEDGEIAGGSSTRRDDATKTAAELKSTQTQALINQTGKWRATDYVEGDISTGSYQVKLGDTLWEISEAVYGDGSQWTKILQKNSSSVGFLADDSQALIVPGQFLTIE